MTLTDWMIILKESGFRPSYYSYLNGEVINVDLYHDEEYITLDVHLIKPQDYIPDEPFWDEYEVDKLTIETDVFAYPEGRTNMYGTWEGNIRLFGNTLKPEYFKKALWMCRNPITAKLNIVNGFIQEVQAFKRIHKEVIKSLKEKENTLLPVGYLLRESEPFIVYSTGQKDLILKYNMFTDTLCLNGINVNLMSDKEIESYYEKETN
jgi:hypothetical protein